MTNFTRFIVIKQNEVLLVLLPGKLFIIFLCSSGKQILVLVCLPEEHRKIIKMRLQANTSKISQATRNIKQN